MVHTPFGPRKSGMPAAVEIPAPVTTTQCSAFATSRASSATQRHEVESFAYERRLSVEAATLARCCSERPRV